MQSERNEPSLRVVVADDHALLLQGHKSMLESHGFEVVALAATPTSSSATSTRITRTWS